ncbi:MAG: M23 family metallopeptidase [Ahrensia sp.]
MCAGYLIATSYLILRDDLLNATMARQARLQHSYEDRISTLRSQVDRITSHRLLDQQVMETKIAELVNRQSMLSERAGALDPVMQRALSEGLEPTDGDAPVTNTHNGLPIPALRPGTDRANVEQFGAPVSGYAAATGIDPITTASVPSATPGAVRTTINQVTDKLASIEVAQLAQLQSLANAAETKKHSLVQSARSLGLNIQPIELDGTGTGGPFIPASNTNAESAFSMHMNALKVALDELDATRAQVKKFPVANPANGFSLSSRFGNRRDPIIGRTAFHAGLDFRTPTGTPIKASGDGVVIKAGRNGGYGKMVEIKHPSGLTTRYAHLSKIYVKKGQAVATGSTVGAAGSTGRSTGPHLHYEVRQNGKPLDPAKFIAAGKKLADQL